MSQDCLQDFLAVATELRVGGIGFDSRKNNDEDDPNSRQNETVFGIGQGVPYPNLDNQQDIGRTNLPSGYWDPNKDESLQNMSLSQRSENEQFGRNDQSHGYSETLDKAPSGYGGGEMLDIEKEEKGEIQKKAGKKKRHYDYLRDPIRVKANDRTGKVNSSTSVLLYCYIFVFFKGEHEQLQDPILNPETQSILSTAGARLAA